MQTHLVTSSPEDSGEALIAGIVVTEGGIHLGASTSWRALSVVLELRLYPLARSTLRHWNSLVVAWKTGFTGVFLSAAAVPST